jgi:hypothetical protein
MERKYISSHQTHPKPFTSALVHPCEDSVHLDIDHLTIVYPHLIQTYHHPTCAFQKLNHPHGRIQMGSFVQAVVFVWAIEQDQHLALKSQHLGQKNKQLEACFRMLKYVVFAMG